MAPKRKRTTDEAALPATRSTHTSTRGGQATSSGMTSTAPQVAEAVQTQNPPPKRSRKAAPKTKKATGTTNASELVQNARAEGGSATPAFVGDDDALRASNINASSTSIGSSTKPAKVAKASKSIPEPEPYTTIAAGALFAKYADEDDPSVIGPEGLEKMCGDGEISLEGALPLMLAWQFGASEMAKLSKSEWVKGTSQLQISSLPSLSVALHDLEDLLLLGKPPLKASATTPQKKKPTPEPYNRSRYYLYAADKSKAFHELYLFCFMLAKPPQARNIDMETASAFWSVLLVPKYGMMSDILAFISEKGTYKGVNKDLWLMMLEFCQTVSPTLEDFETDGAWPTMLDEFVAWKKAK